MNVLIHTHLALEYPELIADLRDELPDVAITVSSDQNELSSLVGNANILVYGRPDDKLLAEGTKLKAVIIPFTGVNRFDMAMFRKRNILLGNSHGNAAIVAERAVGLAMAVCGRIPEFHNDLAEGDWHRRDDPVHPFDNWFSVQEKNISILGTGAIGSHIASLFSGFRADIMGFRLHSGETPPGFSRLTTELEEVLAFGDIVFVALPLTGKTRNLLNAARLAEMKGTYIINVARAEIIEEEPLFICLREEVLAGAGIDAWYTYPKKEEKSVTGSRFPFHSLQNVVVSPHAASHTEEGKKGQLKGALDNVRQYVETGRLLNQVDLDEGY